MHSRKIIMMSAFLCSLVWPITTIEELDDMAVFSFSIMSDNKGDVPGGNGQHMARTDQWTKDAGKNTLVKKFALLK